MLNNPARQLYMNMDIDNLEEEKEVTSTGLLSPRKQMSNSKQECITATCVSCSTAYEDVA